MRYSCSRNNSSGLILPAVVDCEGLAVLGRHRLSEDDLQCGDLRIALRFITDIDETYYGVRYFCVEMELTMAPSASLAVQAG